MRKVVFTIVFSFVGLLIYSQNKEIPQRIKYVTTGPNGKVAMTVIDDTRNGYMEIESEEIFYKYQILDLKTNEPILSSTNRGKNCQIDRTKLVAGNYNLKLFTSNFVITSKLTVSAVRKLSNNSQANTIAVNIKD